VLILGIDTSGQQGSVALVRAQGEELLTLGLSPLSGRQYSERLVLTIAELLASQALERSAIGLIAVASGPGSFTGLRIAIATVKGLAEALGTPIVDVSLLEAIALASGAEGRVMAALDAQRSEVFFGEYVVASGNPASARKSREAVAGFSDFTSLVAGKDRAPKVFTPDEALCARLRDAGIDSQLLARPSAETFARIAFAKFVAGIRADVATLDANYLRRSDAEIFAPPKAGSAPSV
jgi:tRNA threonylcarbamoyladenosine biosynthesis protein TsaB